MFFYLQRNSLEVGEVTVIFQTETAIPNYKEITNFGELIEYQGETIPSQWEFNGNHFYDLSTKPSPFHVMDEKREWRVIDQQGFRKHCEERIDRIKAEVLDYGFDYNGHRQRCRDKDISFMAITALIMFLVKTFLQKDIQKKWYFEDNHSEEFDLTSLVMFMFTGSTFVQGIYDAENYFKTLAEPKLITKEEYVGKVKELQKLEMERR